MKYLFTTVILVATISCSSYNSVPKPHALKVAQFEDGNKENGVVYLSFTYRPRIEDAELDIESSGNIAAQICSNWGYTGARLNVPDRIESKCVQFNYKSVDCITYKATINAVCY